MKPRQPTTYWWAEPEVRIGAHWSTPTQPRDEHRPAPQPRRITRSHWYDAWTFWDFARAAATLVLLAGIGAMLAWRG